MNPDWSIEEELNFVKNELFEFSSQGIICSADCLCFDPAILALVKEGRQFHASVLTLASQLKAGDKLLDAHRRLNKSWAYLNITMFELFHIAVQKSEFLPKVCV